MSKRQKRRDTRQAAAVLRKKPGWEPLNKSFRPSPEEQLRRLAQDGRTQTAYADPHASTCTACQEKRAEIGDDTALCTEHLAAALGL